MGLKSGLRKKDTGFFAAFLFHVAIGIACFVVLATVDPGLVHFGLLGIISLATAYGLFQRRSWALWSIFVVAFMATVLVFSTLYYTTGSDILIDTTMTAYLTLTWIFTIYVASKRRKLKF